MNVSYQLLIFDWDGTLVDSSSAIIECVQKTAAELSLPIPSYQRVKEMIGLGLTQGYQLLFPEAADKFELFKQHYQYRSLLAISYKEILFPGVRELLTDLKQQGYILAVATGKSRMSLNAALHELQLDHLFAATRTVDEAFSKPHPQMVMDILQELLIAPQQALLIGDTEYDMQLAKNSGIDVVAVGCGVDEVERLLAYQPLVCLNETKELWGWLNNR
ncbi:MAG: family hydrolase [Gammaproteobacteria bacterium]|jgi:phosphoglycolate phosphatase|nr:family hydrolase [Gammaproteobacteria bacterium]